ncbi:sensor histidine kinase [Eubacterium multiforme]|uniref:Signal transduction histidine kinase n=1 Tax=Eubacterium multiforme TaxID=83339 RepID=A0ABT9UTM0_9FIRM|nr:ATP-binding protein [Eubacterium multiforme]MDQ0149641.1 signal transduction histidine kinase [Eubacterium multiforme]
MEKLKYIIEDSTIAELLGIQNFTNKESAVLELVKNAFDAKAKQIDIIFEGSNLIIKDDGNGMNAEDIKRHWMHVGKSDKKYDILDDDNNKRILAGSKGIGRFALSRLGENVELYSQKNNNYDNAILWITDWNESTLHIEKSYKNYGTKIIIKNLRDKWNKISIDKLAKYLSRTYNDELMKINIIFQGESNFIKRYFSNPILGYNCTSKISLKYLARKQMLLCVIDSDEFKDEAVEFLGGVNISSYESSISILDELENVKNLNLSNNELKNHLIELGDFSAEFFFALKGSTQFEMEKFLYKYKNLLGKYEEGIILYRNSFSISSYDGTKDWLELGKRSRQSPAAATHPTGSWRVRENQLAGIVNIDKRENSVLEDLSNRQGLNENEYYEIFTKILRVGISEFEGFRQNIIREINKKNLNKNLNKERKLTEGIIRNPNKIKDLSKEEVDKFIVEIKEFKKENLNFKKEMIDSEKRYKYDVRILNVLATSGLKATSIAHEMQNDRNKIAQNCDFIIEAMKAYEIWDLINAEDKTKYAYSNIPELIEKNRKVNKKIISFMDTMLDEVEKKQFLSEEYNVFELLNEIKKVWERDFSWIRIRLNIEKTIIYKIPKDVLRVIFDNLILNSIQQNENSSKLYIDIEIILINNVLNLSYQDNGIGLEKKYLDKPTKILEVHETSRKHGHGLGMWIVSNTINMTGGEIINIDGKNGFKIIFTVGGNWNE